MSQQDLPPKIGSKCQLWSSLPSSLHSSPPSSSRTSSLSNTSGFSKSLLLILSNGLRTDDYERRAVLHQSNSLSSGWRREPPYGTPLLALLNYTTTPNEILLLALRLLEHLRLP